MNMIRLLGLAALFFLCRCSIEISPAPASDASSYVRTSDVFEVEGEGEGATEYEAVENAIRHARLLSAKTLVDMESVYSGDQVLSDAERMHNRGEVVGSPRILSSNYDFDRHAYRVVVRVLIDNKDSSVDNASSIVGGYRAYSGANAAVGASAELIKSNSEEFSAEGTGRGKTREEAVKQAFLDAARNAFGIYQHAEGTSTRDDFVEIIVEKCSAKAVGYEVLQEPRAGWDGQFETRIRCRFRKVEFAQMKSSLENQSAGPRPFTLPASTPPQVDPMLTGNVDFATINRREMAENAAGFIYALMKKYPPVSFLRTTVVEEGIEEERHDAMLMRGEVEVSFNTDRYFDDFLPEALMIFEQVSEAHEIRRYDYSAPTGKILSGDLVPFGGNLFLEQSAFAPTADRSFHIFLPLDREGSRYHAFRLNQETREKLLAIQAREGNPFPRLVHLIFGWKLSDSDGNDVFTHFTEHRFDIFRSAFYPAAYDFAFKYAGDIDHRLEPQVRNAAFLMLPGQTLNYYHPGSEMTRMVRNFGFGENYRRVYLPSRMLLSIMGDARLTTQGAPLILGSMEVYPLYHASHIRLNSKMPGYHFRTNARARANMLPGGDPINLRVDSSVMIPASTFLPALADGRIQVMEDSRFHVFFHPSFIIDELNETTRLRLTTRVEIPKSVYSRSRTFSFIALEDDLEESPSAEINRLYALRGESIQRLPMRKVSFAGMSGSDELPFIMAEIFSSLEEGEIFLMDSFMPAVKRATNPIFSQLRAELEQDAKSWFKRTYRPEEVLADMKRLPGLLDLYSDLSNPDVRRAVRDFSASIAFVKDLPSWYESRFAQAKSTLNKPLENKIFSPEYPEGRVIGQAQPLENRVFSVEHPEGQVVGHAIPQTAPNPNEQTMPQLYPELFKPSSEPNELSLKELLERNKDLREMYELDPIATMQIIKLWNLQNPSASR